MVYEAILFFNTLAGISIISQAAPLAQENSSCFRRGAGSLSGSFQLPSGAGPLSLGLGF